MKIENIRQNVTELAYAHPETVFYLFFPLIPSNFSRGMYIFAMGLFKKVIIADTFGKAVSFGFNTIETLSSMEALLVSLSYTGIFCCS